jgi:hypothetical protein
VQAEIVFPTQRQVDLVSGRVAPLTDLLRALPERESAVTAILTTLGAMIVVSHTVRQLSGVLGERWGGLLIGLPISTALTLMYCLWEHGPHYAAGTAQAGLLGLGATIAFAVTTAHCLSRSWPLVLSVAAGAVTYLVAALLVRALGDLPPAVRFGLTLAGIAAAHRAGLGLRGPGGAGVSRRLSPRSKLLLRTAIPVACLTSVLLLARSVEASWAGLFATSCAVKLSS